MAVPVAAELEPPTVCMRRLVYGVGLAMIVVSVSR